MAEGLGESKPDPRLFEARVFREPLEQSVLQGAVSSDIGHQIIPVIEPLGFIDRFFLWRNGQR